MVITFLINALIGAFIGFLTNFLAIKMLFKPDKPVYIGRFRIPFTPGIIPKEKVRLATSIGTVVGNKLLTGDVFEKALKDKDISQAADKLIRDTLTRLQESESTVRDTLALVIRDKQEIDDIVGDAAANFFKTTVKSDEIKLVLKSLMNRLVADILATPVKKFEQNISGWTDKAIGFIIELVNTEGFVEKLEHHIVQFIDKGTHNASPLSNYLPDPFFESVKNAVSSNSDSIGEIIIGLLDNPQIEKNIHEILNGLMDAHITTRMINVFVSKDTLYKRMKQKIERFLKSESGKKELVRAINQYVDRIKTTSVGEIVKYANREDIYHIVGTMLRFVVGNFINAKLDELLTNQIMRYLADNPDITIGKLIEPLTKGEIPYDQLIDDKVESILCNYADKWVEEIVAVAIPYLLDQKITRFTSLLKGNDEKLSSALTKILFSFIIPRAGEIIKALNIPKLITDKVNEYDITELEEIILSIIDRELKAIILLGGLFGFIIGLAGPLISGLVM